MYQQPTAPQTAGVVLDGAIRLYRASFRSCWLLSLIGSIALAASDLYMATRLNGISLTVDDPQSLQGALSALAAYGTAGAIECDIVVFLLLLIIYSAMLAQMNRIAQGEGAQSPLDALGVALRRLPGVILAAIIFILAVGFTLFLSVAPGVYLWSMPPLWFMALLASLVLLTLCTYLWGKLQFWIVAVFADDVGGIESLRRSWNVTRGNWWRSNANLSIALIIILMFELLADRIVSLLAGVALTARIMRVSAQVFLLPMLPAALLAIYYDLRLRRGQSR